MSGLSRKARMKTNAFDFLNADQQKVRDWIVEYEARFHDLIDRIMSPPQEPTAGQFRAATIKSLFILVVLGLSIALTLGPAYASLGKDSSYVPSTLVKDSKILVAGGGGTGGGPRSGGSAGSAGSSGSPSTPHSGIGGAPRNPGGPSGTRDPSGLSDTNRNTQGLGSPTEPTNPGGSSSR